MTTAHDEALPGDWSAVAWAGKAGRPPSAWDVECENKTICVGLCKRDAELIVAAHNSALRALKEAGNG